MTARSRRHPIVSPAVAALLHQVTQIVGPVEIIAIIPTDDRPAALALDLTAPAGTS